MALKRSIVISLAAFLFWASCAAITANAATDSQRWSEAQANDWYQKQPWLVGANFISSNAINQLEMFQAATFDPTINDRELGLAESIGMNTARVFLQDQLWEQDSGRLQKASRHISLDCGKASHPATPGAL